VVKKSNTEKQKYEILTILLVLAICSVTSKPLWIDVALYRVFLHSTFISEAMANYRLSIKYLLENIFPITRLNRDEAGKIFDEVSQTGAIIVLKNNTPVDVFITSEQYEAIVEMFEDYTLYIDVLNRLNNTGAEVTISHDQMLNLFDISEADLNDVNVDIE
jgi:hypothetical protein